ncbi:MAG: YrdB family protein [Cyclobacteriaceae bacterium]|nr:YrdB family protein [Cyclobacteriaceae bacterium]
MGYHPLNLALRFLLELCVLISSGYMMYVTQEGALRYIGMIGFPLLLAAIWVIFAVRGDKSRSGNTVVPTRGLIRLLLELGFFCIGGLSIYKVGFELYVVPYALIVAGHYLISYDRIAWLLKH